MLSCPTSSLFPSIPLTVSPAHSFYFSSLPLLMIYQLVCCTSIIHPGFCNTTLLLLERLKTVLYNIINIIGTFRTRFEWISYELQQHAAEQGSAHLCRQSGCIVSSVSCSFYGDKNKGRGVTTSGLTCRQADTLSKIQHYFAYISNIQGNPATNTQLI